MIPKLIKYSNGTFKLIQENLPSLVQNNKDIQTKTLILVAHKYSYYDWKDMLPSEKIEELNNYTYELLKEFFV